MTTVEHETTFDEDHVGEAETNTDTNREEGAINEKVDDNSVSTFAASSTSTSAADPTSAAASMFAGLGLLSEAFLVLTLPVIGLLLNVPDLTTWVPISMIGGMITLGFAGLVYDNVNGRRFLSILVIAIMAASAITLLTSPFPIISVNAFAFSVGGEYAISSAFIGSAQIEENAARGFVMQSVGAFLAAAIMFISFLFNPNNKAAFISTVGTSACLVLLVFSLRVRNYTALHLKERHDADALLPPPLAQQQPQTINRTLTPPTPPTPSRWAKFTSSLNCVNENKSYNELEGDGSTSVVTTPMPTQPNTINWSQSLTAVKTFFFVEAHKWPRPNHVVVLSASASWFLWDVIFYSTKLSQDKLIAEVTGSEDVSTAVNMSLVITTVSLAGALTSVKAVAYFGASKCQLVASVITTALIILLKFFSSSQPYGIILLLTLTFVGQVINTTTFVLPSVHLTSHFKTMGQGLAAASGKLGAVVGVRVFGDGGWGGGWDELIFAGVALIAVSYFLPIN